MDRSLTAALAAAACLLLSVGGAAAQDPFVALDEAALATYRQAKTEMLAATDPYVIVAFNSLILHRHGQATEVPFTPTAYDQLKTVDHMALAADGALAPFLATPPAGPLALDDLARLSERARAVDAVLDQSGLPPESVARQHRLIAAALGLVADVTDLARGAGSGAAAEGELRRAVQARFAAYGAATGPLLLANAAEAARVQVDGLDAAFRDVRRQFSAEEWSRLYVIVLGLRMPRAGNLQFGYFVNAMGSDAVDRHLIYAEGLTDRKAGEALLATIVTARGLSATFFGDPMRMDRDILAAGAEARFLEIFGRRGTK